MTSRAARHVMRLDKGMLNLPHNGELWFLMECFSFIVCHHSCGFHKLTCKSSYYLPFLFISTITSFLITVCTKYKERSGKVNDKIGMSL